MSEADEMMRKADLFRLDYMKRVGLPMYGLSDILADFGKQVEQETARDCAEIAVKFIAREPAWTDDDLRKAIRSKYKVKS